MYSVGGQVNERGLPILDGERLHTLFSGLFNDLSTLDGINDQAFRDFVPVLLDIATYNYKHRTKQVLQLFQLVEEAWGYLTTNSDGTLMQLGLALAIKELYGMRLSTLKQLLSQMRR